MVFRFVELPTQGEAGSADFFLDGGGPGSEDAVFFGRREFNKRDHQVVRGFNALGIWLEHMRFGHKRKAIPEGGITRAIARGFHEFGPARYGGIVEIVDIGDEVIAFVFHQFVDTRLKALVHEAAHGTTEFAVLARDQGHHVLVIGAIAHVVVDKYIGLYVMENACKAQRFFGIGLDEIAVEVVVC